MKRKSNYMESFGYLLSIPFIDLHFALGKSPESDAVDVCDIHTSDVLINPHFCKCIYGFNSQCFLIIMSKSKLTSTPSHVACGSCRTQAGNRASHRSAYPFDVVFVDPALDATQLKAKQFHEHLTICVSICTQYASSTPSQIKHHCGR